MSPQFVDNYGRQVTYARISVTDRCNFRCVYCMPADATDFLPREELLTFEELEKIAQVLTRHGVTRFRITGGEPLLRRDLAHLVHRLKSLDSAVNVHMTTNGFLFQKNAAELKQAGLDSVTISLDSLRQDRFQRLARVDGLERVLNAIRSARAAGFLKVKLNAVIIEGFNDDELVDLVNFARRMNATLRFIEFMPVGEHTYWNHLGEYISASTMRMRLAEQFSLRPAGTNDGAGPARYWQLARGSDITEVGFISAVTECFCSDCNRIRITPQGGLRGCLADDHEVNLRNVLRNHQPEEWDERIADAVRTSLGSKKERHSFETDGRGVTRVHMHSIGG